MSQEIFEDQQQAPAVGAGGAKAKLEKQARQLAYDTKYKVKQAMAAKSGGKMDPAAVQKAYLAQLAKSPAPPAVKALAKKKLLGEEYIDVKGFVVDSVTDALLKVFVEKKEEEVVEEVIEEAKGEQKFHIKVTDKKTGNSYHRYATRSKIAELRANPNIASVEMSHYGEAGTKKKAKKDYDGDGKVESSSKEHAGAVHNAIQRSKGGTPDGKDTRKEEVEITEKKSEESKIGGGNLKKLSKKAVKRIDADVDGDVDTDDMKSDEMGEYVPSADGKKKVKTKVQKESFSDWRNELFETKDDEEKEIDVMKGKNKVKVMPNLGEEHGQVRYCPKCDKDETRDECAYGPKYWDENSKPAKEEDPRGMKTKANLVRNKLRAMGLKMSHVPEGELVEAKDEKKEQEKEQKVAEKGEKKTLKNIKKITGKKQRLDKEKYNLQRKGELPLNMSNELEGEQLQEKPGDGYLGPTPIPNPIRLAKDAVDATNRTNAEKVKRINKVLPGSASMPKHTYFNKGPSAASQRYLGLSHELEGETIEETPALALKLGLAAGTAVAATKIGQTAIDKVKGMVQKKREAEAPYQKLLNQETEVKGETVSEEDADRLRDRRMERGGVGGNRRYDRAPKAPNTKKFGSGKTMAQKEMEKKYGKGASAMDIVRAQIQAKHGKGAIMDTKKKKDK
jgi:hypothetical protein